MIMDKSCMIIPKDTILYHTSDKLYRKDKNKKMLFCVFHPSEWEGVDNEYIYIVRLARDIKLLFLIKDFCKRRIISSLPILANNPNISNLAKQNNSFLSTILPKLEENNFDGWVSSIENKAYTEVALLNSDDIFKVVKVEKLKKKWRNSNNIGNAISLKNWGTKYPIFTNVRLHLHKDFKPKIEKYIKYSIKSKTPNDYAMELILQNATILYF
jgi:hypothetical protein